MIRIIKKISLLTILLMAITLIPFAHANVVINQILYDSLNSESDGEAIEIYNSGSVDIDISGWLVKTETSSADATLPQNTTLGAHSFYLIADGGFSEGKDNASWPDAQHEEEMSFTNSNAGAAIIANGTVVDAVGWGNSSEIDEGLYEGTPAVDVHAGKCLVRVYNTNDNSNDFVEDICNFSATRLANNSNEIEVNVSVGEGNKGGSSGDVSIDSIMIQDDDNFTAGVQILPLPGANKSVNLEVVVSGTSDDSITAELFDEFSLNKTSEIDSTTSVYQGNVIIEYYREPGEYNLTISAGDETESKSFVILPLVALEIVSSSLSVSADAGDSSSASSARVRNLGNVLIDVGVFGTDLVSISSRIPLSSIEYGFNSHFEALSYNLKTIDTNIECGLSESEDISFRFNIPEEAYSGNYKGTISLVAVGS